MNRFKLLTAEISPSTLIRLFPPPLRLLSVRFGALAILFNIPLITALAVLPPPARRSTVINIFVITLGRVTSVTTLKFLAPCNISLMQISWLGKERAITLNTKRATRPSSGRQSPLTRADFSACILVELRKKRGV